MSDKSATRSYFVLSALGTDRPGIVAQVTEFLRAHGCNVEESRMAILGGEFGLLMLVSAPQGVGEKLGASIGRLESESRLEIRWKPTQPPQAHRGPEAIPYLIKTYGLDHEGIIHAISQVLYGMQINIVSASTSSYPAPVSGTPLFQMEMEIDVPRDVNVAALRAELEKVARDQNADVELAFEEVRR